MTIRYIALFLSVLMGACSQSDLLLKSETSNKRTQEINQKYIDLNKNLLKAENFIRLKDWDDAKRAYELVLEMDPGNPRAKTGILRIDADIRHKQLIDEASNLVSDNKLDSAKTKLHEVLIEDPSNSEAIGLQKTIDATLQKDYITPKKLNPTLNQKVSLEFRNANLQNIFQVINRITGINFIFDSSVKDDLKASIFVKDAYYEDVIDFLLLMHQLNKKVLSDTSLLIFPANKSSQYDDLIIRTYFLSHTDSKQAAGLIKQMVPVRDVFIDEKLNSITVKATYEQMENVQKLLNDQDIPDPEVVLDVEILEIKRSRLTDIGVKFPDSLSVIGTNTSGIVTVDQMKNIKGAMLGFGMYPTGSGPVANLLRQDGDTNLLANPRIRVKSKEKAKIHIGDKIPIETTTASSTGYSVGKSATYLDVGLKLEVEPRVALNNDVNIKLNLEVSNATLPTGAIFPTVNTRNTATILMSADGETQVLAGLINDEDRKNTKRVPGLSSLPLIGRLFSDVNDSKSKTEVVLLITPHVIRNIQRPEAFNSEFYSGSATYSRPNPLNISPIASPQGNNPSSNGRLGVNPTSESVDASSSSTAPASAPIIPVTR